MKKFKITLESHSHTMKEISEDYNITDGIYEVEVSDPENGSEIYQAVKKKYQKGNNMILNKYLKLDKSDCNGK